MASHAWNISVGVKLDTSDIQSQLNNVSKNIKLGIDTGNSTSKVKDVTQAGQSMNLTYQAAYSIFSKCTEAISSMVTQVMEVDKALIEFQKVSDLSGQALENYADNLAKVGLTVARTRGEMVESATMFRKSGFNDADSAMLAEVAAKYQNIADTEVTASEAASSIVSQLRAFGWGAENATHIIDSYNEV